MEGHLVRVGTLGHVGRFAAVDGHAYPRGARVICRTDRGLEIGEVLTRLTRPASQDNGTLLRGMTVEDELLWNRIEKHKSRALNACTQLLDRRGIAAVLMDVELLFDGQSIFFYFLGDPPPGLDLCIDELAETYDAKVQFRKFTEAVTQGCGPDCGTETASGCGDACHSCAIAGDCATRR